jgi:hypothetical protein
VPTKLDFLREDKDLYRPGTAPALVTVPPFSFLAVDGKGDPNTSPDYTAAVSVLYTATYALKFAVKKASGVDYGVLPLEGLWWSDNPIDFSRGDRRAWQWTMMIRQPVQVTEEQVAVARDKARAKAGPAADLLRLVTYDEGASAQLMHRGPYADEAPAIARLHEFIAASGLRLRGKPHEIYLSDPNRTSPERMRTVLRQPVEPVRRTDS